MRGILGHKLAHEVTHSIKTWSEADYNVLTDYIRDALGADFDTLVKEKMDKLGMSYAMASDEVIADGCEMLLRDSKALEKLAMENANLFVKVVTKVREFIANLRKAQTDMYDGNEELHDAALKLREALKSLEEVQEVFDTALENSIRNMREALAEAENAKTRENLDVLEKQAEKEGLQFSEESIKVQAKVTAKYQSEVDKILKMQNTNPTNLIIGYTPSLYRELGMPSIPFVIGSGHVYSAAKTEIEAKQDGNYSKGIHYHGLGDALVKNIYSKLQDPVMIIAAKDVNKKARPLRSTHSVVAIVDVGQVGESLLLPVEITDERTVNGEQMDVNVLSSAYTKNVAKLIKEAISLENIGDVGIYYAKKEATNLIPAGVQFPIRIQEAIASGSIIRSFDQKVNRNISKNTESSQFKRWFGDWQNNPARASKAVNRDGTPKVLYHYTDNEFDTFDISRSGANQGKTHGDGIYLSSNPNEFSYAGKNRMQLYAAIFHPFEMQLSKAEAEKIYDKYFKPFHKDTYNTYKPHVIDKLQSPTRVFDYLNEAAEKNNVKTGDILSELGYDGVHDGPEWVAFKDTQVKSATDNIGTFDGANGDIYFSEETADEFAENEKAAAEKALANMSVKDYNRRGWLRTLLTREDASKLRSAVAELFINKNRKGFRLKDGSYAVEVNNKIIFVSGTFENPRYESVLVFNTDNATEMEIIKDQFFGSAAITGLTQKDIERFIKQRRGYGQVYGFNAEDYKASGRRDFGRAMLRSNTKGFGDISQFEIRDGVYTKDEGSVSVRVQGLKFSEETDSDSSAKTATKLKKSKRQKGCRAAAFLLSLFDSLKPILPGFFGFLGCFFPKKAP